MNTRHGMVFVENQNILQDMIEDEVIGLSSRHQVLQKNSRNKKPLRPSKNSQFDLLKEEKKMKNLKTEAALKQSLDNMQQQKINRKEKKFPALMVKIDNSVSFLDSIDKDINLIEETKMNKIRRQFEEWNSNVHGSIQVV